MIRACASKWDMLSSKIYRKLQSTECIDRYLVTRYDILHTQGTDNPDGYYLLV